MQEITPSLAEKILADLAEQKADEKTREFIPNRAAKRKEGSRWGFYRMPRQQAKRTGSPLWFRVMQHEKAMKA